MGVANAEEGPEEQEEEDEILVSYEDMVGLSQNPVSVEVEDVAHIMTLLPLPEIQF